MAAGALAARAAALLAGLATASQARRWRDAQTAADAVGVPVAQLRRWARRPDVTWATWPTTRTLLVDVEAFDRWLTAGRFTRDRQRKEAERQRPKPGISAASGRPNRDVAERNGARRALTSRGA